MAMTLHSDRLRRMRGMGKVLAALGAAEGITRYVGGAVRDDLLGLKVNDVDFATRLRPDEVVERLSRRG